MKEGHRNLIQLAAAFLMNPHLGNFAAGRIDQGPLKSVCVPGLNCYSCPAAAGACPIGSLQAVLGHGKRGVSYYVSGLIILFGVVLGRAICGFLCPFGFLQDLLHKLRAPRLRVPRRLDRGGRYVKYAVLAVMVVALPLLNSGNLAGGDPYFCKYLCPAGTLEGGIPLLLSNASLRAAAGALFTWKAAVLAAVLLASLFLYRPFCKYLCPLGALYGLFNRVSFLRMTVDERVCIRCGACENNCPMQVEVLRNINSAECIRCGRCSRGCPAGAIHYVFAAGPKKAPGPVSGEGETL